MTAVPKIEAQHVWAGGVTLGDPSAWPRFDLKKVDGLGSLGDREDNREAATARPVEIPRRSLRRGKTVVYAGLIKARSAQELRVGEDLLLAAFREPAETRMDIVPPAWFGGPSFFYFAGAMAADVMDEQTYAPQHLPSPWVRPFVVALRMSDPRVYRDWQIAPAVGRFAPEGLALPVTLPVTIPPGSVVIGSRQAGGLPPQITVMNDSAPTEPLIDVPGPLQGLWLYNDTLGLQLVMPNLNVGGGSVARVDFSQRVVRVDGTEVLGVVDPSSTWWDVAASLAPGVNLLHCRSLNGDVPCTVLFCPASGG